MCHYLSIERLFLFLSSRFPFGNATFLFLLVDLREKDLTLYEENIYIFYITCQHPFFHNQIYRILKESI